MGRVQRLPTLHFHGHCGARLVYADIWRIVLLDAQVRSLWLEEYSSVGLRMYVDSQPARTRARR